MTRHEPSPSTNPGRHFVVRLRLDGVADRARCSSRPVSRPSSVTPGQGYKALEEISATRLPRRARYCIGGIMEHGQGNRDPDRPGSWRAWNRHSVGAGGWLAILSMAASGHSGRTRDRVQSSGALRVQVRTRRRVAPGRRRVAERSIAPGAVVLPFPLNGCHRRQGGPPDLRPHRRRAFVAGRLKKRSRSQPIKEVDLHPFTPEFARAPVDSFYDCSSRPVGRRCSADESSWPRYSPSRSSARDCQCDEGPCTLASHGLRARLSTWCHGGLAVGCAIHQMSRVSCSSISPWKREVQP